MKETIYVFLLLLLFVTSCSSQDVNEIIQDFTIELKLPEGSVPENLEAEVYFIYGNNIDSFEQFVLDSLSFSPLMRAQATIYVGNTTKQQEIKVIKRFLSEDETTLTTLGHKANLVVLVGSQERNKLTAEAYSRGYIINESTKFMSRLILGEGRIDKDTKLIVLRHNIAPEKLERKAAEYSPLRQYMPEAYIPVAATTIGMLLLFILPIIQEVIESFVADKAKTKMTIRDKKLAVMGINIREAAEISASVLVLGLSVTWTFAASTPLFFQLLVINFGVSLLAVLSHELAHRIVGKLLGIKTEYRLWLTGSMLTLLTGYLGNSFGIQGFLIEKREKNISGWRYGIMKLVAPITSLLIALTAFHLFTDNPQPILQMTYTTASIIALAEILPVRGSDGEDIRDWNQWIWFILFIVASVAYSSMNFI